MSNEQIWPANGSGMPPARQLRRENPVTRAAATLTFLADATRRRPSGRRVLWAMVSLLTVLGVGMVAYPFATQVWANHLQHNAKQQFASAQLKNAYRSITAGRIRLDEGEALTRLKIKRLNVDMIVVEGDSGNALRAGAGHDPDTALPGEVGNVAIFGHRTGFGEPFRHLDTLRPGDMIELDTPIGTYMYRVGGPFDGHANPWVTRPTDWSITAPTPTPMLTLITCDPPHTSAHRLAVRATLVNTDAIS